MLNPPVPTQDLFAWHRALRGANTRDDDGAVVVAAVLSRQALALAFVIGTFMDSDGTTPARWSPGLDRLSDALGYPASDHRKAVGRLLGELQEAGYLIVTRRPGRFTPNLYTAAVPVHQVAGPVAADPGQQADRADYETGCSATSVVPGAAPTPRKEKPRAALRTVSEALGAVGISANVGIHAAQPSPSFTSPFPAQGAERGTGAGGRPRVADVPSEGRPDTTATKRLFDTALTGMPRAAADELVAAVTRLPNRYELAEQVNALCALGAADKIVAELARPYDQARKPAAVAASRVRALWCAYGRPTS